MADFSTLLAQDPELVKRALAAQGGGAPVEPVVGTAATAAPVFSETAQQALTPAPVPAPVPAPAVESAPAVEQAPPAVEGPAIGAPDAALPQGNLNQQKSALTQERVDSLNATGDSFEREGEAKAGAAKSAAQVYAEAAKTADRYADAAERRYMDNQERADHYRRMVDDDFARLQQEPPKPGKLKSIFNVITGIIGAAAGGETGAALGMLSQHVNREAEEDAAERGRAKERMAAGQQIRDSILTDSQNEFDASAKLVANQWLVSSRQLEQIANESNVPAFREQALRLSIAAKDQARGILEHNVDAQIKARAASMRPKKIDYANMTPQELDALEKAGMLPESVMLSRKLDRAKLTDAENKAINGDPDSPEVMKLKQEAAKTLRLYEAAEPDAEVLRNMVSKLDAEESTDVPGVGPVAGHFGDWAISKEGVRVRQAAKKVLKAQLRDESGAAIGEEELEAYMNDRGMGPTATNTDFLNGVRTALNEFESKRDIARQAAGRDPGGKAAPPTTVQDRKASVGFVPKGAKPTGRTVAAPQVVADSRGVSGSY